MKYLFFSSLVFLFANGAQAATECKFLNYVGTMGWSAWIGETKGDPAPMIAKVECNGKTGFITDGDLTVGIPRPIDRRNPVYSKIHNEMVDIQNVSAWMDQGRLQLYPSDSDAANRTKGQVLSSNPSSNKCSYFYPPAITNAEIQSQSAKPRGGFFDLNGDATCKAKFGTKGSIVNLESGPSATLGTFCAAYIRCGSTKPAFHVCKMNSSPDGNWCPSADVCIADKTFDFIADTKASKLVESDRTPEESELGKKYPFAADPFVVTLKGNNANRGGVCFGYSLPNEDTLAYSICYAANGKCPSSGRCSVDNCFRQDDVKVLDLPPGFSPRGAAPGIR